MDAYLRMNDEKELNNVKQIFRMSVYKGKFRDKQIVFSKEYHHIRNNMREIPQIRILRYGNSLEDEMPKGFVKRIMRLIDDEDENESRNHMTT